MTNTHQCPCSAEEFNIIEIRKHKLGYMIRCPNCGIEHYVTKTHNPEKNFKLMESIT